MSFSRIEPAPLPGAPFSEASAPQFSPSGTLWTRLDQWLAQPRSAAQVVLWVGLYLVLTTNWPLWNELARIGGAPSTYLPTVMAMSLLTLCGSVAILSLTAWSRWLKPLWFAVVVLAGCHAGGGAPPTSPAGRFSIVERAEPAPVTALASAGKPCTLSSGMSRACSDAAAPSQPPAPARVWVCMTQLASGLAL